jgi:hypothetical protein
VLATDPGALKAATRLAERKVKVKALRALRKKIFKEVKRSDMHRFYESDSLDDDDDDDDDTNGNNGDKKDVVVKKPKKKPRIKEEVIVYSTEIKQPLVKSR